MALALAQVSRNSTTLCLSGKLIVLAGSLCVLLWCQLILYATLLQILEPLLGDSVEKEEHVFADSPPTMPKDHVHPLMVSWSKAMCGRMDCQSACVCEGRELTKDCHVQFCPSELTTLTPVVLDTLNREHATAWTSS